MRFAAGGRSPLFRQNIRNTLLLLLLVVLVPVVLVQAVVYYSRFQGQRAQEYQANLEVARAVAIAFDSHVQDVLHQELAIGRALVLQQPLAIQSANDFLRANVQEYPSVRDFNWVSPQGRILAASRPEIIGVDLADRAYFQQIVQGREWVVSDLLEGRITGDPTYVIVRGIRETDGSLLGVVLAVVPPEQSADVLPITRARGGDISIVDRQGWIVYHFPLMEMDWARRGVLAAQPDIAQALAGYESTGTFVSPIDGQRRMGGTTPLGNIGWLVRASRPEAEVVAQILSDLLRDSGLLLLVTLGSLLTVLIVSRNIIVPIERLRERALALGRGELGHRAESGGPSELRDLAAIFNRMAEEIRLRERQLRESERRYAATLETTPAGVVLADAEGRIVLANHAAEVLLGRPKEEIAALFSPEYADRPTTGQPSPPTALPLMHALRHGESSFGVEVTIARPDGTTVHLLVNSVPISDPAGHVTGAVGAFVDITPIRELERQREEFAAVVAHDLRGALTIVRGNADFVIHSAAALALPDRVRRSLEAVSSSSRRAERMILDLLDVSRLEARRLRLEKRRIDLPTVSREIVERAAEQTKGHPVLVTVRGQIPPVEADPDRIEQVLNNLLSNAAKYAYPETEITVELEPLPSGVMVAVTNLGPGILPEDRESIFTRFYRTQRAIKGSVTGLGLGLYIVKGLIEAHGGRIWVESEPGRHATFRFTLPAAD